MVCGGSVNNDRQGLIRTRFQVDSGRRAMLAWSLWAPLSACASSSRLAVPVNEEMFVPIGGIEQWITIHGSDRNNPVVLFLHGGPGNPLSLFADSLFAGWGQDLTLVQWDQRGAGRTFGKNPPTGPVRIERMVEDGVEVAEFLRKHLGKRKIMLVGGSWGSILGVRMAHARPDLFSAYVGAPQSTSGLAIDRDRYDRLRAWAAANNEQAVATLTRIGPPPWRSVWDWVTYRQAERPYESSLITSPPAPLAIAPAYATPEERQAYEKGERFSLFNFWNEDLSGPIMHFNLSELGADFALPIVLIQGSADIRSPPDRARAYLEELRAPRKTFHLLPGAGHEWSQECLALIRQVLLEEGGSRAARSGRGAIV